MMETKFRGKANDPEVNGFGEWIYGDLVHIGDEVYIQENEPPETICRKVDPDSAGQFVGLKDKKGKDIYHGDIVKVQIDHETTTPHVSAVGFGFSGALIFAHPAHCSIMGDKTKTRDLSDYCGGYSNDCEVIGNVIDNSEILEKKA